MSILSTNMAEEASLGFGFETTDERKNYLLGEMKYRFR